MRRNFPQKSRKKQEKSAPSPRVADAAAGLAQSSFLHGLHGRFPALIKKNPDTAFRALLSKTRSDAEKAQSTEKIMSILRQAKQQAALIIGHADLAGIWDDVTVMLQLSAFADMAVQTSLRFLLADAARRNILHLPYPQTPEKESGICVIALGKWGAHELNYSSDIDLMVLFDPAKSPVIDKQNTQQFFIRLTRDLARMLEEFTADGYVFRCDLRLRPDPGAMPLAVSIETAETYYGSLGQNWERAAMIKARPVAGDEALGNDFNKLMNSWIWRRNLDFAAIQDIHSIKRQINAKQQKKQPAKKDNPFFGFNVKLGHGGIREIEFFAQTQQLIYGGRDITLRTPSTLATLDALCRSGHVSAADAEDLKTAYLFLRHIEHRLQMLDDQQTHSLPLHPDDFSVAAQFAGYKDSNTLTADLKRHTDLVRKCYAALFTESESLSSNGNLVFTGVEDDPETLETLKNMGFEHPSRITAAVRGWHHGRYRATRSERARQILTEIIPPLLAALGKAPHADDAFARFDRFLEKLPSGIPIFSMFLRNPLQMELVADVMGMAPALADWLSTHPQVLDGVLSRDFFGRLPTLPQLQAELSHLLSAARDYQDVLDLTRRFAREKRFHAGIHILKNLSAPRAVSRYLSDIAEAALTILIPHVEKEFAAQHGRFQTGELVILGMGSFAAQSMFTDSDLDLVGLYHVGATESKSSGTKPLGPSVYYIRLMQRLITAVSAPTSESVLYDIDTRLRPAGNDGPLAVSLDGFFSYQHNNAWTWEHMCLIRSRVIYASAKTKRSFDRKVVNVLKRPRDAEKLRHDMLDMQAKVKKQFGHKDAWHIKYRDGGFMDMMFALHYLVLKNAHKHQNLFDPSLGVTIQKLQSAKLLAAKDAKALQAAADMAVAVQGFLRLTSEHPFQPEKAPAGFKKQLIHCLFPDAQQRGFTAATKEMNMIFKAADAVCRKILNPPVKKAQTKAPRATKARQTAKTTRSKKD